MKIQIGEVYMDKVTKVKTLYPNATRKYLAPCLEEYGKGFMAKLDNTFKVAMGVGDIVVGNRGLKHEKHIFILLDSKVAPSYFQEFLHWIRDQSMYADDYVYDNIQKSYFHMVILKLPEKYYDTFETFKIGEYSKMYNRKDIDVFFRNHQEAKQVLIKDHNYKITFVGKMNKKFGTTVNPKEWDGELDYPPDPDRDIFNHHLKKSNE